MAVIPFPSGLGFNVAQFDPVFNQLLTGVNGGSIQTVTRGKPVWAAKLATPGLTGDKYAKFQAFLDLLEGSANTFVMYDPRGIMPLAYRTLPLASDPWTQSSFTAPRLTAYDFAASTLTLDRVATGAVISASDYISVVDSLGGVRLFRVTGSASGGNLLTTFSPIGNTIVIPVTPRPELLVLNQNIVYRKAGCEMKLVGRPQASGTVESGTPFTLEMVQFLRR